MGASLGCGAGIDGAHGTEDLQSENFEFPSSFGGRAGEWCKHLQPFCMNYSTLSLYLSHLNYS